MTFSAVKINMLYCPKCQHTYEMGSQRFCSNDGARLLVATGKTGRQAAGGVFSTLLGKTLLSDESAERKAPQQSFSAFEDPHIPEVVEPEFVEPVELEPDEYKPPFESSDSAVSATAMSPAADAKPAILFDRGSVFELELPATTAAAKQEMPAAKPLARVIRPNEIPSGTASVGDRKSNPAGRNALTWEKPKVLLGQTVKGRYYVTEMLGQDEVSISYLADDKIALGRKVFVRVFMDEDVEDDPASRIFAEERVSLSHINHPNIARVLDSGELQEGKPFIVSEYLEGKTVRNMLDRSGQFNALRTARIIQQAAHALSEAHQNGILHRNLKPENLFLTVSDSGSEQVKLTNFGVLYDKIDQTNLPYKSPEQLDGKLSNFASDIFSLGVIAFQMLTNRLPFNSSSTGNLLKSQREGLTLSPTNLRLDLSPQVDEVLQKALAFKPAERFPKARDFGDALFSALSAAPSSEKAEKPEQSEEKIPAAEEGEKIEILPAGDEPEADKQPQPVQFNNDEIIDDDEPILELDEADYRDFTFEPETPDSAKVEKTADKSFALENSETAVAPIVSFEKPEANDLPAPKSNNELPWEKRSPEPLKAGSPNWLLFAISALGLMVFLGVWYYFLNRPAPPIPPPPTAQSQPPVQPPQQNLISSTGEGVNEVPPVPRQISQPPDTIYFENSKQNLKGELAKNFLGFSLYYPKDWEKGQNENNYLDIIKKSADGTTIKAAIITRYSSKGTFNADKPTFATFKENSDKDLSKLLENYLVISSGETTIQDGRWKAFEVKFQGGISTATGSKAALWGRRYWVPVQRPGVKSGFVITVLATSLDPNVTSVDQVAVNDELKQILDTFEPSLNN